MNLDNTLTKKEIIRIILSSDNQLSERLFAEARNVRNTIFGNKIHLRGIIEFSNFCRNDCFYCGIRLSNNYVVRYRIPKTEIVAFAERIYKNGIHTIVLQSGEDYFYKSEDIAEVIKEIKKRVDVAITLSIGERSKSELKKWAEIGADRYLLKHETSNKPLYEILHPGQSYNERIELLQELKLIGYQIGSGNIIGLPGQSVEDIAEDILLCKDLDVDMASFSPFIPADNTPLSSVKPQEIQTVLKVMALARIVLRNVHIPATTALSTLHPDGRKLGLLAGANVIMPTFTPNEYRNNYMIYRNKPGAQDDPELKVLTIDKLLKELGLEQSFEKGHSQKKSA